MDLMSKIQIDPIAAESFGIRSMATFIKTPDTSIVVDPGCSLGQRMRLDPHPREYEALFRANQRLVDACKKAEVLTISHFHYDHLKPNFTDNYMILTNHDLAEILYTDKIILAKDFRENINHSQRQRGYFFNKFAKKYVKEIVWADGQRFIYGNTTINISKPLPHGEHDSKQGFIVSCMINYEDEVFIHATVQGPIVPSTLNYLLSFNPTIIYVGGPPVYLKGFRILETTLDLARTNMIELVKNVPKTVIDHHLLRDPKWKEWLTPVFREAEKVNHWVGTAADLSNKPLNLLEANRKDLYAQDPPARQFITWTKKPDQFKKETIPPTLNAIF